MKKAIHIIFFIILSLFSTAIWAQPVTFGWANRIIPNGESCGIASVTDAAGNVYIVGYYTGSIGLGITSDGKKDIFVHAINPTGGTIWAKSFGGTGDDIPTSICIRSSSLFITGTFEETAVFGSSTPTAVGGTDIFLLKLSASIGSVTAFRPMGGPGNDEGNSISVIGTTNLCLTGSFEGTVDLNPDYTLISLSTSQGAHDIFIEKLDLSFNLIWKQTIGGTGDDIGKSVVSDANGNIYTTGSFEDTMDVDPGFTINNIVSFGSSDIFIQKLNASGNFVWGNNSGDILSDEGKIIKTDASGNVFVYGDFSGTPDFDPGFTLYNLSSNGGTDIFLQKLDSLGNFINAFSKGGTLDDHGNGFVLDASGNIYCTGAFQNTVDFDPGAGTSFVTSAGLSDMYIQKLNSSFTLQFIKTLQGTETGVSNCIAIDASANVYTGGNFSGTADFDPNAATFNLLAEYSDYYYHKLNSTGVLQWAKQTAAGNSNYSHDVCTDLSGNVYRVGQFYNSADFDPGPGTHILKGSYGGGFIQKLSSSGNLVWAYRMVDSIGASCYFNEINCDSSGNLLMAGVFGGTVDLDPGSGVAYMTSATGQLVFEKLDPAGNMIWVKMITLIDIGAGSPSGGILSIESDGNNNVYISGSFSGTIDADPGTGVFNLTTSSNSDQDIFICKYDVNGNLLWAKRVGGTGADDSGRMKLDSNGNPVIIGDNELAIDTDPGTGVFIIPASSVFVLKLDTAGDFVFAKGLQASLPAQLSVNCLTVDNMGNIFWGGLFRETMDFDPGAGTYFVSPASVNDHPYLEKLDTSGNFLWVKTLNGYGTTFHRDLATDSGGSIYITGNFRTTVDFDPGPASYLVIHPVSANDTYIQKLNSNGDFVWVLNTMSGTSGAYQVNAMSYGANNSIHLIGNFGGMGGDVDPTSGTYPMNGIASQYAPFLLKLNQCFINTTQTQIACNDFTFNGITYTNTGIYTQSLGTSFTGCDSTITLDLTINGPDDAVTQSGNILTATQSGAGYQWINCTTGMPIIGETSQSYAAIGSGSFAVEIDFGGCIDTSACIPFIYTGIPAEEQPLVNVYPSPFTDNFTLEYFDNKHQSIQVEVSNLLGQVVYKQELMSDSKQQIVLNDLQSGMYIVKMYTEYSFSQKHIVKE